MTSPRSDYGATASIPIQRLDNALQRAQREPERIHHIDSRDSTPPVYPEHGPDEFEYWRDMLEKVSQSLEALDGDTTADEHRARILKDYYWREESNHWKSLCREMIQGDFAPNESIWDKHHLEIDSKYWEAVRSLNWKEIYHALDIGRHHRIMENREYDFEDRRRITADIVYYKIAAQHWQAVFRLSKSPRTFGSFDLNAHRASIQSRRYWQAEFEGMSEALLELKASRKTEGTHITPKLKRTRTSDSLASEKATSSTRRRSKRIEIRDRNRTITKFAKPQGIHRRKARAK